MFSRIWSGMPAKTVCRRLHIERTEISKAQGPVAMLQERPTHDGGIGGRLLLQLHMFDRDRRADRHAALAPLLRPVPPAGGRTGSRQRDRSLSRCSALAQISFSAAFIRFSALSSVHSAEGRHPSNRLLGGKLHIRNVRDICRIIIDQMFGDL